MKRFLDLPASLVAILPALCGSVLATQQATLADFDSIISANDYALVSFISPSFESSQELVRQIDKATEYVKSPLLTVDCTVEKELCRRYDVASYPSIRFFNGLENSSRYRGLRQAPAIVSYMVKERLPPLSLINKDNIDAFRQVDDTVILAYLDEDDDWLYEVYAEVASERHKDFVFGITNDYDLAAHHNLSVPSVVAYKRRDNDHKSLTGQFDKTTMETFLRVATPLLIGEITKRNIQDYVGHAKPVAYIFSDSESSHTALRRELTPVARKYSRFINFAIIDSNEYAHMAANLELEPDKFPAFVIHNILNDEVYPLDQSKEITAEAVDQLVKDITEGKAKKAGKFGESVEQEEGVNVSDYEDEDDEDEEEVEKVESAKTEKDKPRDEL